MCDVFHLIFLSTLSSALSLFLLMLLSFIIFLCFLFHIMSGYTKRCTQFPIFTVSLRFFFFLPFRFLFAIQCAALRLIFHSVTQLDRRCQSSYSFCLYFIRKFSQFLQSNRRWSQIKLIVLAHSSSLSVTLTHTHSFYRSRFGLTLEHHFRRSHFRILLFARTSRCWSHHYKMLNVEWKIRFCRFAFISKRMTKNVRNYYN